MSSLPHLAGQVKPARQPDRSLESLARDWSGGPDSSEPSDPSIESLADRLAWEHDARNFDGGYPGPGWEHDGDDPVPGDLGPTLDEISHAGYMIGVRGALAFPSDWMDDEQRAAFLGGHGVGFKVWEFLQIEYILECEDREARAFSRDEAEAARVFGMA